MTEQVRPDHGGACVSNIVPTIVGDRDRAWLPAVARDARTVVLLVIDGLGWAELQRSRARLPNLASMDGGPITTVVPSTTSTVLTSITTGAAPAQHGILGFRMRVDGAMLNVLRWLPSGDGVAPNPKLVQPVKPFLGKSTPVVTRSSFKISGFSEAHMRGVRFYGWFTTSTLIERARQLAVAGDPFIYSYYDGVDHVAHVRGLNDAFYDVELAFADRLVGEMLDGLPSSATLLVTADHGQIELPPSAWTALDKDVLDLVELHSGDARFRYLHAREGAGEELLAAARERLGARAWVFSREELARSGILGPEPPTEEVAQRLGDVVLAAREPIAFVDPALPEEVRLRSGHGSMTEDEMFVPLLAARGRA